MWLGMRQKGETDITKSSSQKIAINCLIFKGLREFVKFSLAAQIYQKNLQAMKILSAQWVTN